MFQATAPVSIPVGPELAGIGSGNGIGPGTGTGNGISVSWQSPPVIFKGIPVSEALSHNPLNFILTSPLLFSWKLFSLFCFSVLASLRYVLFIQRSVSLCFCT